MFGSDRPRVSTPPRGRKARGAEAIAFARDALGLELMPWQEYLLDRGCRTSGARWSHRTVVALTARQSGKTLVTVVRILAGMLLFGEREVIAAAHNRELALDTWRLAWEFAERLDVVEKTRLRTGAEELLLRTPQGIASYKVVSSVAGGGRGRSADLVVMDEVRQALTLEPFASLEKTRRARPGSQLWAISTEGDARSVVLDLLQKQGRAAASPGSKDTSVGYFEWSAAPERARDDVEGWREANPALGHTISMDTLEAEYAMDPPEVFETEVLCRRVQSLSSWLPSGAWSECEDRNATMPDGAPFVFGIDAGPELRHATIVVAAQRPDGNVFVEAVASAVGTDAAAQLEQRLHELCETWGPRQLVCVGRGAVEALVHRVGQGQGVDVHAVGFADLDRAVRSMYEAVMSRRVVHLGDLLLAEHLAAATQAEPGKLQLRRRNTTADMDGAVAAIVAHYAIGRLPDEIEPSMIY